MAQADSNDTTNPSPPRPAAFLTAVARIHLSHLFQDPFVRDAFARTEQDPGDDFGELVETDHPRTLDGGAAERMTETTGHRVLAMVEG
jgi:hypothetical protein